MTDRFVFGRHAALTLVVALALTACGKNQSSLPTTETPPSPANAPVAAGDGAPQIAMSGDGVHIEYHVYGKGEPAVILIHGWSCDGNYWSAQLAELKSKYTTVTVDLAGHGASGNNRTDWSMGNFGEDVAAVARQLQNMKIVLVGHSMGGPVALEAMRRIGDRVIGIVAVDSLKTIGQPVPTDAQVKAWVQPFRDNFIGHTREFVSSTLFTKDADPKFVQKVAYDMSLEPQEVAVPAMESLLRMDFSKVLPDVHVPIIAINSSLPPAVNEAQVRKVIPNFKAVTIDNTDHFLMLDAPDRFNPALLQALADLTK